MADPQLQRILEVEVPVIVEVGRRQMKLHDIIRLIPGSIVELPKSADEDLELLVNNKPIGAGEAVKVGESFGIRIHYVGDLKDRIRAMGESEPEESSSDLDEAAALAEAMLANQS
jgi:flagellar motor switch protein FliN/FliY